MQVELFLNTIRIPAMSNPKYNLKCYNNRGALIFAEFVILLHHENKNPTKYHFPIDCCNV